MLVTYLIKTTKTTQPLQLSYKKPTTPKKNSSTPEQQLYKTTRTDYEIKETTVSNFEMSEDVFDDDVYENNLTPPASNRSYSSRSRSRTPLLNLNGGAMKRGCRAKTRLGTPCKISSLPGRDYCYRHQGGDSVMLT